MTCNPEFNIRNFVEKFKDMDDSQWGEYMLSKDPLYGKMNQESKSEIIRNSIKCAEEEYEKISQEISGEGLQEYIEKEGIKLTYEDEALQSIYTYLSLYIPKSKTIIISNYTIDLIKKEIEKEEIGDILKTDRLIDMAIAHELFHHIEEKSEKIYTREKNMEYLLFGKIKREACAAAASEIAAVCFSKLVAGITFCPSVFEIIAGQFINIEHLCQQFK